GDDLRHGASIGRLLEKKRGRDEMTERTPAAAGQPGGPTPERINQLAFGYAPSAALATAVELSLFTHVAQGKNTLADLEKATGASRRGLQMLVNTMVGLQFLTREGTGSNERFGLTPESEAFLVEGKPSFLGRFTQWSVQR